MMMTTTITEIVIIMIIAVISVNHCQREHIGISTFHFNPRGSPSTPSQQPWSIGPGHASLGRHADLPPASIVCWEDSLMRSSIFREPSQVSVQPESAALDCASGSSCVGLTAGPLGDTRSANWAPWSNARRCNSKHQRLQGTGQSQVSPHATDRQHQGPEDT